MNGLFESAQDATRLHRRHVPEDLIPPILYRDSPFTLPPRPLSSLPNPANLSLKLALGERISGGRAGDVHRVSIEGIFTKDGLEVSEVHIPPLVVKIARRRHVFRLAREAWFYDELETLQGVATARCFGWFEAPIPSGLTPYSWHPKHRMPKKINNFNPYFESDFANFDFDYECEDENDPQMAENLRIKEILGLQESEGEDGIVSLLLLEELGGNPPMSEDLTPDIR